MSGPVTSAADAPAEGGCGDTTPDLELIPSHEAEVGGVRVRRALPRRGRRTIGAWCFADHTGPVSASHDSGLDVGPHPHIELQTVTWLIAGEALHRDSGELQGIQLWVAQPEGTRHGPPAFEHHAELPQIEVGVGTATVPLDPVHEHGLVVLEGSVRLQGRDVGPGVLAYLGVGRDEVAPALPRIDTGPPPWGRTDG